MITAAKVVAGVVALQHVLIFIMESFLWRTLGARIFKMTPEVAETTATLALNQGVYNLFLAAGLAWALSIADAEWGRKVALFFLGCVVVAGIVGGLTAKFTILLTQGGPALLGLVLWFLVRKG